MNPAAATALTIMGSFIASVWATWMVRGWLERRRVLDSPNARSSHDRATVTGGGIALTVVLAVLWLFLRAGGMNPPPALLLLAAAFSVLGLLDDIHNVPWMNKLLLQFVIAVYFVASVGGFTRLDLFGFVLDAGWLTVAFSVLWIVGFVNVYNFMDGIDGLAGGYGALCACVLGVWFILLGGYNGLSLFLYGLMAVCLGFLVWNWAPARIFLGDAGSMMIGGILAAASIIGERRYNVPLSAFVLLYAVFIGDAGYTLARRALKGEQLWRAHKEHLYQRATQSGLSHSTVTIMVLLLSMILCLPASLEMSRNGPRALWLVLSALLLGAATLLVKRREARRQ